MIKTLLQARQLLDAVGWPYSIHEVDEGEQLAVRTKLGVPEGVGSVSFIMMPKDVVGRGQMVVVFDGEVNYAGTYNSHQRRFIPASSRREHNFERWFS